MIIDWRTLFLRCSALKSNVVDDYEWCSDILKRNYHESQKKSSSQQNISCIVWFVNQLSRDFFKTRTKFV